MKVKDLINELKKYNPQATVEINDPNPKTAGSRPIWYVEADDSAEFHKIFVDIVMVPTDGPQAQKCWKYRLDSYPKDYDK